MTTPSNDPTPTSSPAISPPSGSSVDQPTPPSILGLSGVTSSPPARNTSVIEDDVIPSSLFRARSHTPGRLGVRYSASGNETPPGGPPTHWWGGKSIDQTSGATRRPWRDSPKRKKTVPEEQTEGWEHTKLRVGKAAASVLGTTGDIVHETLILATDVLQFAPIPGLAVAAKMLLNIWDTLQLVDTNRLACLRLTERCADILLSVRQEIHDAGDSVGEELAAPINTLVESFDSVHIFLQKEVKRPFLKRYLKRDEILDQIKECDASLTSALGMFSLSIQIRILRQVQEADRKREKDSRLILDSLKGIPDTKAIPAIHIPIPPAEVLLNLRALHDTQNAHDMEKDLEDLCALMRTALAGGSDVEILNILQIDRDDMPEAIKTLQRALERIVERQGAAEPQETVEKTGKLGKKKATRKKEAPSDSGSGSGEDAAWGRDTLHREFIESGIDALKRMSKGDMSLPSWTITRYEVDRDEKIGIGFFSDVYKGSWHGRTVAIKVLTECTPRELFRREVVIWTNLKHENVLELYGASSASGDPPWFFVSPYEKNGSLVTFLKRVAGLRRIGSETEVGRSAGVSGSSLTTKGRTTTIPVLRGVAGRSISPGRSGKVPRDQDLFRFMLEIAKGMEYLHANGVLHGDLKAANVLVDDKLRCVISDFGQSEMKSEAYRISRTPLPHGTLRWQAPELMSGSSQLSLTRQMDIYSYAILCVEIVGMGRMPWPLMDDEAVRHFVLIENARPPIPISPFDTPALQELLRLCWIREPEHRPTFERIVLDVKLMRKNFSLTPSQSLHGHGPELSLGGETPRTPRTTALEWDLPTRPSPDMRPGSFQNPTPNTAIFPLPVLESAPDGPLLTIPGGAPHSRSPPVPDSPLPSDEPRLETTVPDSDLESQYPVSVLYTPSSSRSSSLRTQTPSTYGALEDLGLDIKGLEEDPEGYMSPQPTDERVAKMRDERRYRLLLEHSFHPSLTLPLWGPCCVDLGAVGYLSKPAGTFVTLFNSLSPEKALVEEARGLPSLYGYGKVTKGSQKQDKRNAAQRGLAAIIGFLTFMGKGDASLPQNVARRYSFPLRAGHKAAYMCTETTMYHYIERLEVPKKWLKANIDAIMRIYGSSHKIQKEDLFLVIGTLDTPDYALFVSHNHPDGQAHFNVYSAPRNGQPWGVFTTDTEILGGPSYHEPTLAPPVSTCKISPTANGRWETVLLARLRFKPDCSEPTSL